jgi:hypothetical protein
MARKTLRKSISTRLNEQDYDEILAYSEASEIAMADLLRIGAKHYMTNNPLVELQNNPPAPNQLKLT